MRQCELETPEPDEALALADAAFALAIVCRSCCGIAGFFGAMAPGDSRYTGGPQNV